MADSGSKSGRKNLIFAANSYRSMGYSVLPVYGAARPGYEKVAAVPWKAYQQRFATDKEIQDWFGKQSAQGIAIITGRISNLVVLDFDDADLAAKFAQQHPHLTQTRTVLSGSRGLPHYYYKLPGHLHIGTQKCAGVDLQADGRYVVAAPTPGYQLKRGGLPLSLTASDIHVIERFLTSVSKEAAPQPVVEEVKPSAPDSVTESITSDYRLSPDDLRDLYIDRARRMGRNNALFQTAIQARDHGYDRNTVMQLLAPLHVNVMGKGRETERERYHEARKTLRSAYSRPARKQLQNSSGLPNSVREAFLQRKQTAVVRVLDALYARGLRGGEVVTERQVCDILHNIVGRYSIMQALKALYDDENAIFRQIEAFSDPSPKPLSQTDVAMLGCNGTNNKCLLFTETKPNKNLRGRPARKYEVPNRESLCSGLGVSNKGSDSIDLDEMSSGASYRQAVNRSLIARRPGRYTRKWLAKRIGVTVRTWQRYVKQGVVQAQATFHEFMVSWRNLKIVPEGFQLGGAFLRDELGRRYPALQTIARRLLGERHRVTYVRQDVNCYWVGSQPATAVEKPKMPSKRAKSAPKRGEWPGLPVSQPEMPQSASTPQNQPTAEPIAVVPMPPEPRQQTVQMTVGSRREQVNYPKRYYRQVLPDTTDESAASRLYQQIKALNAGGHGALSMANARKLVVQYGRDQVMRALKVLQRRDSVENPAGFVWAYVRSEALVQRQYVVR